jgi:hypothetical protein
MIQRRSLDEASPRRTEWRIPVTAVGVDTGEKTQVLGKTHSAGSGNRRGRREVMPNPVSHTPPLAESTRMFAGLMSLWMRPRSCT